jgi:hypothetical protein
MESKKINQLATELAPDLSDITIIGDPNTGISKKITLSQMASLFTGTVEEYANFAAFPLVGVADTIYIAKDTNVIYRWDSTAYVVLSPNIIASLVFNDANGFDGTISLVGSVATLTITTALTSGSVPFIGASGALSQDNANLFFDDTNNRLGIATASPTTPLDVFGSGIIGRINATSTNNAYLGFASNGTNKWSAGNVQSDHRFRIFSEANSAELITILQTGEFGIGIANPLTKLHIDGGASALIANLDANVSVAKTLSFRSDNSNRINLEVSGTESGSNAGADFFLRAYSDAGSLLNTPLTITRATGAATFISSVSATALIPTGSSVPVNGMYLSAANTLNFATNTTNRLTITSAGNFGIGVIPSAWGSGYIGVQYGTAGSQMSVANNNRIGLNYYFDGTNFKAIQTGSSSFIEFDGDIINFRNAPSVSANATQTHNTRLLITSAGNIGIGVTPSAWGSGYIGFQYGTAGSQMSVANNNRIGLNYYFDGAAFKAIQTGAASLIEFDGDNIYFKNAASVSANAAQTLNTRLQISSAGNIGIGGVSANYTLDVNKTVAADFLARFLNSSSTGYGIYVQTNDNSKPAIRIANASGVTAIDLSASGVLLNGASGFGALDVGGQSSGVQQNICRFGNIAGVNNGLIIQVNSSNNYIYNFGTVGTGSAVFTANILSATSDMNLKVADGFIDNALEKVLKIIPRYFYWKEETGIPTNLRQLGFFAQEINEALGEEVANAPKNDNEKWGIYDRGMIAMLTKAIQEQQVQIEELKAKIK